MNLDLIEQLGAQYPWSRARWRGYDTSEIQKIERLYDIRVSGQLERWLRTVGRCSGGITGDESLILYRKWSVRTHVFFQADAFSIMQHAKAWDLLGHKPFVVSFEDESIFYFVLTTSTTPDKIYRLVERTNTVEATGRTLFEHIADVASRFAPSSELVCTGELIDI